jgi:hypothetical protein
MQLDYESSVEPHPANTITNVQDESSDEVQNANEGVKVSNNFSNLMPGKRDSVRYFK